METIRLWLTIKFTKELFPVHQGASYVPLYRSAFRKQFHSPTCGQETKRMTIKPKKMRKKLDYDKDMMKILFHVHQETSDVPLYRFALRKQIYCNIGSQETII